MMSLRENQTVKITCVGNDQVLTMDNNCTDLKTEPWRNTPEQIWHVGRLDAGWVFNSYAYPPRCLLAEDQMIVSIAVDRPENNSYAKQWMVIPCHPGEQVCRIQNVKTGSVLHRSNGYPDYCSLSPLSETPDYAQIHWIISEVGRQTN